MACDLFISYKREDMVRAKALAEALERRGWTVWWDPQLPPGEHFDDVIESELKTARLVLVLWSERSVQSRFVKDEANYALELNKLVPIAIEAVDLPFRFRWLQTLDFSSWAGSEEAAEFKQLAAFLTAALAEPRDRVREKRTEQEVEPPTLQAEDSISPSTSREQQPVIASRPLNRAHLGIAIVAVAIVFSIGILLWQQRKDNFQNPQKRAAEAHAQEAEKDVFIPDSIKEQKQGIEFAASNEAEPFAMKGNFKGYVILTPQKIEVRVASADLSFSGNKAHSAEEHIEYVRAGLAFKTNDAFDVLSWSQKLPVDKVLEVGQSANLGSFNLIIPRLNANSSAGCWVVFEIGVGFNSDAGGLGYSYAHTRRDLF